MMSKAVRIGLASLSLALCGSCATSTVSERRLGAARDLAAAWAAEGAVIKSQLGGSAYSGTPDQGYRGAAAALTAMGFEVDATLSQPPHIVARRGYPAGEAFWTRQIKASDEARARDRLVKSLGSQGASVTVAAPGGIVTARTEIGATQNGRTMLSVDFSAVFAPGCQAEVCLTQMPPAALREGYGTFWSLFAAKLEAVRRADTAAAKAKEPRLKRPPRRSKDKPPRSGWVTPGSGWLSPGR